jgi:hypothetical protein
MSTKHFSYELILICILCFLSITESARAQTPDKSIEPFAIRIIPGESAPLGHYVELDIYKIAGTEDMHGFDFLIGYDANALTFVEAVGDEIFDAAGAYQWEHFEYQSEAPVSCGWCPSGLVRAIGIADLNNGEHHPLDLSPEDWTRMFRLVFLVTNDPAYECEFTPVRFFWIDCGDNTLAIDMPPTIGLALSDDVFDWDYDYYYDIDDGGFGFPGYKGAPDACVIDSQVTARFVDFYNGDVEIECWSGTETRGDINVNGVHYEIADWVMFSNYFISGYHAFGYHVSHSVIASDVDADGIYLKLDDLLYLHRVICGDTVPVPWPSVKSNSIEPVVFTQDLVSRTISIDHPDSMGAVFLVFEGEITPELLVNSDTLFPGYSFDGQYTRVLIQPLLGFDLECDYPGISGPLFTYTGYGRLVYHDNGDEDHQTSAADYNSHLYMLDQVEINIIDGYDGETTALPQPLPQGLVRTGEAATFTVYTGNYLGHDVSEVDLSSVRVNDIIIPQSVTVVPPPPGFSADVLEIIVPAGDFIDDYRYGPDPDNYHYWLSAILDTLSTWEYVYSVSGQFLDNEDFISLGNVTIIEGPVTIPVPSGWPTIGAAVEAAESHDTVEVAGGIYAGDGNRDISMSGKSLVIRSVGGPEVTTINCGGSESEPHRAFMSTVNEESGSIIDGFNIINGYHENGGAISLIHSDLTIRNCFFQLNESNRGGALYIHEASPIVEYCLFFHNQAEEGGAIHCWASSDPMVKNCTFSENTGTTNGAGLYCYNSSPVFENTLIAYNNPGETVYLLDGGSDPQFSCCDIYGNDGGNWTGGIADQLGINGNFSEDPMFCDTTFIDFHIDGKSPCAATNNSCLTLIGLFDVNCGIRCGDVNFDGFVNIGDPVYLIAYMFRDGPEPLDFWASDLNGNLELDIGDAVLLINFIFRDGPPLECVNK